MRKQRIRILTALLICCMACTLSPAAEAKEAYGYKIRIFAGDEGTIDGGSEMIVYDDLEYGEEIYFDYTRRVQALDRSRYYAKGLRESGTDTSTVIEAKVRAGRESGGMEISPSITVTGDRDYVVAYGAFGSSVAYTVRYEDSTGNELAPAETYYGNIGDQPVIAFLYIENYLPQAYNLTGELQSEAEENVFTFVYSPISRRAAEAAEQAAEAARASASRGTEGNTAGQEAAAQAAATEAAAEADGTQVPDLQSIDDEETPLSNMGLDEDVSSEIQDFAKLLLDIPIAAKAGILSIAVLLTAGIVFLLKRRKRKTDYAK